jgi:hypothetical protein
MSNSTIAIVLLSSHVSSNAIALRPKPEPHNQGPTCPTRPQQRMSWCDMTAVGGRQPGPSRVSTAGSRRHSCKRDYALAQTKARGASSDTRDRRNSAQETVSLSQIQR